MFLSCVSTSPGPMCLSSKARAFGEGCRVARWSGVISSKSFCSQLARLDNSSFRKRTFPCKTHTHTQKTQTDTHGVLVEKYLRNQQLHSVFVSTQPEAVKHTHLRSYTLIRGLLVMSGSICRSFVLARSSCLSALLRDEQLTVKSSSAARRSHRPLTVSPSSSASSSPLLVLSKTKPPSDALVNSCPRTATMCVCVTEYTCEFFLYIYHR